MKYIKTFESLKQLNKDQLDKLQDGNGEPEFMIKNETDNTIYKVSETANNWYYNIKWYYKKPGYVTYCFLKTHGPGTSQFWIEEDKLLIPTEEELEKYMILYNQHKFNI